MRISALLLCGFLAACASPALAQRGRSKKTDTPAPEKKKTELKTVAEVTKSCISFPGLFTLYQDTAKGTVYLALPDSMLGREFIYFSHIADGVASAGLVRGNYQGSKVITFHRHFERVEVRGENTNYHFDPANPISRASEANINTPILASLKLEAAEPGLVLVSGDALFLAEEFQMVKPPSRRPEDGVLGKLSTERTRLTGINNYPANTEVAVRYVYENRNPTRAGADIEDARFISIGYQHALLAMPDSGFTPRRDDHRIGYFSTQVEDMTSTESAPWRDMIHRWRLEKADPTAAISEPVTPITWWIENTTPHEFRDYIREGVERWNLAFEPLGFRNAVVVKEQPDTATWDAGDVRYNVLRWTSSPNPAFSGYGPSFVNPRTGEILGADIMLEWSGMTGRLWREEVFRLAGLDAAAPWEEERDSRAAFAEALHRCDAGSVQARSTLFAAAAMQARSFTDEERQQFIRETLQRLVLHEVGHTLGLTHNMAASTLHAPEVLHDPARVRAEGLAASVMDYPAIHFPLNPAHRGSKFFDDTPGPYDLWAIAYGYSVAEPDANQEDARLEQLLSRSLEPALRFGNDADDMRSPGGGMNPDVNIYDLSSDPVAYAAERCALVRELYPEVLKEYRGEDQTSYHEVRRAFLTLSSEYATQLAIMARPIGGVRYLRGTPEQLGTTAPLLPVPAAEQQAAMRALVRYAFAPDAFDAELSSYAYLQSQRRGFGFFGEPEDPKIHARILAAQTAAFDHLMHPRVLQRITDSGRYGNTYSIDALFTELTSGVFAADLKTSVSTVRQQLQLAYTDRLIEGIGAESRWDPIARSMALSTLRRIEREQKAATSPDALTRAHREHLLLKIDKALNR